MTLPSQEVVIRDPGLGLVAPATSRLVLLGCCSSGTNNAVKSFSSINDLVSELGQGPLVEDAAYALQRGGAPVLCVRVNGSIVGAAGAVTPARVSSSTGTVAVAGAAFDAYEVTVEVLKTGTLGAAHWRYTLDGVTWSPTLMVPGGGTYVVPQTGLTLTFAAGAGPLFFETGDRFAFTCTAPFYSPTDLGNAIGGLVASPLAWDFLALSGVAASASAAAALDAALDGHLAAMQATHRPRRGMLDAGSNDTPGNVVTAYAALTSRRVLRAYGGLRLTSAKGIIGWQSIRKTALTAYAARAAASLISTDLARVATGPVEGVTSLEYDEFRSGLLDDARIATMRTWEGRPGYYPSFGWLASPPGSDFTRWQFGRLMDVACATLYATLAEFINAGLRSLESGALDERDAERIETRVNDALRAVLTQPQNIEGTGGHVSAVRYSVIRTNNVVTTETLLGELAMRPHAYPKFIKTQVGYSLQV